MNPDLQNRRDRKLPHTLTILPTYRCTAACSDCCFQSNPTITKRVPQERLLSYIDQAAELSTIRLVCFSGGEAFLLGNDLVELIGRCAQLGFMTRIVTNGYWSTTLRAAEQRLAPLVEAGLNEINFSTGDDHARFVPVERVLLGLETAQNLGLGSALMIEVREGRAVTKELVVAAAQKSPVLRDAFLREAISVVESPWMPFRSERSTILQEPGRLLNRDNVRFREPCTSVLTTIVVTPEQELGLCCGLSREGIPDLHAGSLLENSILELVTRTSHDFLKIWLFVEGPEKMLAWAASKDRSIKWEDLYAHNCDTCRAFYTDPRVMHVVEQHYLEKYEEIMTRYALFLASKDDPPQAMAF